MNNTNGSWKSILLVDDDKFFIESVKNYILEKGDRHNIITSYNGEKALSIIETENIDLMTLDLKMPVMNGFQLLNELLKRNVWLPIIILAKGKQTDLKDKAKIFSDFGVMDYMEKPVNLEKLDKKIEEVLNAEDPPKTVKSINSFLLMLDILESQKKKGIITIKFNNKTVTIFFNNGIIFDINDPQYTNIDSIKRLVQSPKEIETINLRYINHKRANKLNLSLKDMIESLQLSIENNLINYNNSYRKYDKKILEDDNLSNLSNLLNSFKEVEHFYITDLEGKVYVSSNESINETFINSIVYFYILGEQIGQHLKMNGPNNYTYYLKSQKVQVFRYKNYIIIFKLKAFVKQLEFKKKMEELFYNV